MNTVKERVNQHRALEDELGELFNHNKYCKECFSKPQTDEDIELNGPRKCCVGAPYLHGEPSEALRELIEQREQLYGEPDFTKEPEDCGYNNEGCKLKTHRS